MITALRIEKNTVSTQYVVVSEAVSATSYVGSLPHFG